VLARYRDFFAAFEDFRGYVDFWLLQDVITDDYSAVRFFTPFDEFKPPAIPQDLHTYREYRRRSIEFVEARNRRMTDSGSARDSGPTRHPWSGTSWGSSMIGEKPLARGLWFSSAPWARGSPSTFGSMTERGTPAGDGSRPKTRYHLLTTDGGIVADQPGKMAGEAAIDVVLKALSRRSRSQ
jgi:hypothetical protein